MSQTLEEQLKKMIINQYGDIKKFSNLANIPNSTLNSIFQRGILKCNISNIIQLANTLNISVDSLAEGKIEAKQSPYIKNDDTDSIELAEIKEIYYSINDAGKNLLLTQARLIAKADEYQISPQQIKHA